LPRHNPSASSRLPALAGRRELSEWTDHDSDREAPAVRHSTTQEANGMLPIVHLGTLFDHFRACSSDKAEVALRR